MNVRGLIDKLECEKKLETEEWTQLISGYTDGDREYAAQKARAVAAERFGNGVYFRGIVEFTSYCKNDCLYCGIRRSNRDAQRYRLSGETVLACCHAGYEAGFRTFVLQGGEDAYFTNDRMEALVASVHSAFPDCAVTLSIGERSREAYERFYRAGAARYLLRHETACAAHYAKLHPSAQSFDARMRCLRELKEIGYQTGCGMMVGAPYQTAENLAADMRFMGEFQPAMIGTGPFIPHHATPFAAFPAGSVELTLLLLSLCRIMLPDVLLPATTALGTLSEDGRKRGILAGANVIMPNLSPKADREKYLLYDNKKISGEDAAESLHVLRAHLAEIGYRLVVSRGDYQQKENAL